MRSLLKYERRHLTAIKNVLSATLNKTFLSFLETDMDTIIKEIVNSSRNLPLLVHRTTGSRRRLFLNHWAIKL